MAQPKIEDDIKFLWGEIKLGLGFLHGFFKDKADDDAKKRKVAIIEYGPFNSIKLFIAIIITAIFFIHFQLWRFEATLWATLIIGIVLYDIILQKGWIYPLFVDIATVMYEWGKDLILWMFPAIWELGSDILQWAWETVRDVTLWAFSVVQEIFKDITDFIFDTITGIFNDIFTTKKAE
jgi:hypothetical protein